MSDLACKAAGFEPAGENMCFYQGSGTIDGYLCENGKNAAGLDGTICTKKDTSGEGIDQRELNGVANMVIGLQKWINQAIWPILVMIGGLMDNSLLFGSGMETTLREIWIPIRNIVNILFIVGLVGIALYNVLGIGDDQSTYSIKAILPKIIVAIIAVNFSFLGIKVVLDTVNVLTVSVFTLPNQVNEGLSTIPIAQTPEDIKKLPEKEQKQINETIKRFCKALKGKNATESISETEFENDIYITVASKMEYLGPFNKAKTKATILAEIEKYELEEEFNKDIKKEGEAKFCNPDSSMSIQGRAFLAKYNSRNAALAMVLNNSNILFYGDLPLKVENIEKLFISALFGMLMYVIYMVAFVSLFIILLARIVVLWLVIAMSPVLMLSIAIPTVKEKLGALGSLSEKFIKHAIAPLIIGLSMTVGWIMIGAIGGLSAFEESSVLNFNPSDGLPLVGFSTLQDLIVSLGTVAVIWLGIKSAAEGTIAESTVTAITGAAQSAGKWLGALPLKHIPMVPVKLPNGQVQNATLSQAAYAAKRMFGDTSEKDAKLYQNIFGDKPTFDHLSQSGKIKDKETAHSYLKKYGEDIKNGSEKSRKTLEGFMKNNTPAYNQLNDKLRGHIKDYAAVKGDKKEDIEERKRLGALIVGHSDVVGAKDVASGATPTATADTDTAAKEVTHESKYGGKTLKEHAGNDDGKAKEAAKEINKGMKAFGDKIKGGKKKEELIKEVGKLVVVVNGHRIVPTKEEIHKSLGDEKYQTLVDELGGGKGRTKDGETALDAELAKQKTAASTGTAGAGTTAGGAGANPAAPDTDGDGTPDADDPDPNDPNIPTPQPPADGS